MANRAQRRRAQKQMANSDGPTIAQLLKGLAKKPEEQAEQKGEDLNVLPLPATQEKVSGGLEWTWNACKDAVVVGFLSSSGNYDVSLQFINDVSGKHTSFDGDEAKLLGQALISAWNYQNVWKLHAGHFLEQELGISEIGKVDVPAEAKAALKAVPTPAKKVPAKKVAAKRTPKKAT